MANDVYIKFGEDDDDPDLPDIEGDSTDAKHWWWCELRDCGFDMASPQQADDSADSPTKAVASTFKSVTLKKRVDWASTQLFRECIKAAMNSIGRPLIEDGKPQTGIIDQVTVEVCRPAGGEKVACAKAVYFGVRIIRYGISMSEPEPAESITFEFDKVKFCYFRTDPRTGELLDVNGECTDAMENHHESDSNAASQSSGDGQTSAGDAPGATPAAPALAPAANGGAPAAPGSTPDATVNVNFPGLWQGTGFGVLPD
ncbi:MAG TPA: type VI secretion system tube protein Hcp [Verrucomicrobiae bacterium]|nr:type VI secretion system tube protein Hcp [Verrucomicrobiae bacterium]